MGQVEQQRGARRLSALGLEPVDTPPTQDAQEARKAAHRALYEAERARFIQLAENGLHMAPGQALYGMVVQAIKDANGWERLPPDWPDEHPTWPTN